MIPRVYHQVGSLCYAYVCISFERPAHSGPFLPLSRSPPKPHSKNIRGPMRKNTRNTRNAQNVPRSPVTPQAFCRPCPLDPPALQTSELPFLCPPADRHPSFATLQTSSPFLSSPQTAFAFFFFSSIFLSYHLSLRHAGTHRLSLFLLLRERPRTPAPSLSLSPSPPWLFLSLSAERKTPRPCLIAARCNYQSIIKTQC